MPQVFGGIGARKIKLALLLCVYHCMILKNKMLALTFTVLAMTHVLSTPKIVGLSQNTFSRGTRDNHEILDLEYAVQQEPCNQCIGQT